MGSGRQWLPGTVLFQLQLLGLLGYSLSSCQLVSLLHNQVLAYIQLQVVSQPTLCRLSMPYNHFLSHSKSIKIKRAVADLPVFQMALSQDMMFHHKQITLASTLL